MILKDNVTVIKNNYEVQHFLKILFWFDIFITITYYSEVDTQNYKW